MYRSLFFALLSIGASQQAKAAIQKIATMDDYERICKSSGPCVIVFNSETCTACESMEKSMVPISQEYPACKFYSVQTSDEAFKTLDKQKLQIKAWPTTHFIKGGSVKRTERGAMGQAELDRFTYELIHDKPKPQAPAQAQPANQPVKA
jgi:thiol-disulfide isomerase/thioredoxin